jgi:hypothetical protein
MTAHALRGRTRYPGKVDERVLAFLPTLISGMQLWLDFSDATTLFTDAGTTNVTADGQAIYQVNDKSGNGANFVQATSAARPIYRRGYKNNLDVARFDGSNDFMRCNKEFMNFPSLTVASVWRYENTSHTGELFRDYGSVSNKTFWIGQTTGTITTEARDNSDPRVSLAVNIAHNTAATFFVYMARLDASTGTMYAEVNGSGSTTTNANYDSTNTWEGTFQGNPTLGALNTGAVNFLNGYICEHIIYSSAVSDNEFAGLRQYLNKKWAIY